MMQCMRQAVEVKLDTQAIPKKDDFKYVESVIQGSTNNDYDIIHHIDTMWRVASKVSCNKNAPPKLNLNVSSIKWWLD